jgi:hypothetical protein
VNGTQLRRVGVAENGNWIVADDPSLGKLEVAAAGAKAAAAAAARAVARATQVTAAGSAAGMAEVRADVAATTRAAGQAEATRAAAELAVERQEVVWVCKDEQIEVETLEVVRGGDGSRRQRFNRKFVLVFKYATIVPCQGVTIGKVQGAEFRVRIFASVDEQHVLFPNQVRQPALDS